MGDIGTNRKFVAEGDDLSDTSVIGCYYEKLLSLKVETKEEVDSFLEAWAELNSAIQEFITYTRLRYDRETNNLEYKNASEVLANDVESVFREFEDRVAGKFLFVPLESIDKDYYTFRETIVEDKRLYKQELEVYFSDEQKVINQYRDTYKEVNSVSKSHPIPIEIIGKDLVSDNRDLRKYAWQYINSAYLKSEGDFEAQLKELSIIRTNISKEMGIDNFVIWKTTVFSDLTIEKLKAFIKGLKEILIPAINNINERQKVILGETDLKPWDFAYSGIRVDLRSPNYTFNDLVSKVFDIYNKFDKGFFDILTGLYEADLIDILPKTNKIPGCFFYHLPKSKTGAILLNVNSNLDFVKMLIHESGHAIHYISNISKNVFYGNHMIVYRNSSQYLLNY